MENLHINQPTNPQFSEEIQHLHIVIWPEMEFVGETHDNQEEELTKWETPNSRRAKQVGVASVPKTCQRRWWCDPFIRCGSELSVVKRLGIKHTLSHIFVTSCICTIDQFQSRTYLRAINSHSGFWESSINSSWSLRHDNLAMLETHSNPTWKL